MGKNTEISLFVWIFLFLLKYILIFQELNIPVKQTSLWWCMLNFSNHLVCLNHTLSPSYQKPMDWSLSCIFSFDNLFLSNVLHNTEEINVLLILLSYIFFLIV